MKENSPSIFDAVRIVRLPDGSNEMPVRYSQTGRSSVKIGDVGVVIGEWLRNRLRVEAIDLHGFIEWQDVFSVDQLELVSITDAPYCRRRINEVWSRRLASNGEPIDAETYEDALNFARKVMVFARRNVEVLVDRLSTNGYRFASNRPFVPPSNDAGNQFEQLSALGVHVPIALQAWLLEVGRVDLCGSHPDWQRSAYTGMFDGESQTEGWYTDPLVIDLDLESLVESALQDPSKVEGLDIAPDVITKANVSGGGPVWIQCSQPSFDNVLIGQHGSFTLLSYLSHAFSWAGFPGFDYIPDAPTEMLRMLASGLVRL